MTKYLPFIFLGIVYFIGAFCVDVMDIDAAQYANISREMADNNNWLQVQYRGEDYYLDKPPLLFWLSALMFKIFGASNFAYRLIPILSTLLGLWAVYRFTKLYYSEQTAYIAALVMGCCQAFFLMNHDVRCDTLLTNCVMVSIWQIAEYLSSNRWKNLIWGFIFAGLAMLAKGPIAVIVVGSAFFVDFVLKRDWKNLFRWQWLVGIAITGLVLLPYCIGLQRQYGNEGLYFFFWKQSFGRITGESDWANSPGLLFQAQNFLWSFLPWVVVFVLAIGWKLKQLFDCKFRLNSNQEAIALGGFVLPFVALSTAQYQLPHYTFVVFSLAAVITAEFVDFIIKTQNSKLIKSARTGLVVTIVVMALAILILCTWAFPLPLWWFMPLFLAMGYITFGLIRASAPSFNQLVLAPFFVAVCANLFLNAHVYPTLLSYQTGSQLGKMLSGDSTKGKKLDNVYLYIVDNESSAILFADALDFYTRRTTPILKTPDDLKSKPNCRLYTDGRGLENLSKNSIKFTIIQAFDKFHVTGITLPFLNPKTRLSETNQVFFVKIN
jgi:4-amino-4-deoxy-L-arabinose transferase-like glycosyltransferase